MNVTQDAQPSQNSFFRETASAGQGARLVRSAFKWAARSFVLVVVLSMGYWIFSSDRYVSEATVLIQNTEAFTGSAFDLSALVGASGGANRPDQLLLREYLLSVDMLKKLDAQLHLRAHYSDKRHDLISRLWFPDASIEWFYRYYRSRVHAEFDDYAGVLHIRAAAYNPETAQAIAAFLVSEGERYMNELSHDLANTQVAFLTTQVGITQRQVLQASQVLLDFQNQKGLSSPQAAAEHIHAIIGKLETQRTEIQTQLGSLPRTLVTNHPNIVMLKQALTVIEQQISQEREKLASTTGKPLNLLVVEQQGLQMDVDFKKDVYKTALIALEKGRMDASRTIKRVSVLQAPLLPEYAMEPRRLYGITVTLCLALAMLGILKLLEAIILDHVD